MSIGMKIATLTKTGTGNHERYLHLQPNLYEDCCLLDIIQFFDDIGLPDQIDSKAFESLSNKFFSNVKS